MESGAYAPGEDNSTKPSWNRQGFLPTNNAVLDDDTTPGDATRVHLPHPEILQSVKPGDRLLIDDGKLQLRAVSNDGKAIVTVVVAGTKISDKKGVSLPDTDLPLGALTEKDRRDLDAVLHAEVDWIALSFVQRPEDLAEVRKISRGRAALLSKIEKPQAVARLAEIIEVSDAIMVARGDLGVEMPLERRLVMRGDADAWTTPQEVRRRLGGRRRGGQRRLEQ
jgi:pyruvate kinase